ncbi:MAG TPA: tetratricopeptide repeat protein [Gemmata sp.]
MSGGEIDPLALQAAEAFDHLAGECCCHDRLADAAAYYHQSLAVRERVFGPDHHEVADSLVRLAGVGENGPWSHEAEALWRRAIGIYERYLHEQSTARGELFGHVFMGLIGTLGNVACAARSRGDIGAAEEGYRRVGAVIAGAYGPSCAWLPPADPFAAALIEQGKRGSAEVSAPQDKAEPGAAPDPAI